MNFWTELVDAAVLGSRATLPSPPPSLADLARSEHTPAGTGLLRLAAVASRARRACYVPAETDLAAPGEAPPDDRPGVSVAASRRLADLLDDERDALVIEWLRLLAGTGRRPPEARLPDLLWRASSDQALREALIPVLGPLAAWLAAANPVWEWVAEDQAGQADLGTWTTASHGARREMLAQVRSTDPAAGRDLVAATWQGDSARDRTAFIAALEHGLGADDEPLLDRALADARGEVRQAAADLLAKLPGSAFSNRAAARAAAAVKVGDVLVITPPAEATEDMIADGFSARPPRGSGLQAWLLRQVIAAPPAAWWTGYTGLTPADLLVIAAATPWAAELEAGWTESAMRDADQPWLTALLDRPKGVSEMATALLKALPPAERDSWLAAHPDSPLFAAIELVPAPWSARLSAAARDRIIAVVGPGGQKPAAIRRLLRVAASRLDPPAMPDQGAVDPVLANAWAEMMNTLSIRAAMRRELAEEPAP